MVWQACPNRGLKQLSDGRRGWQHREPADCLLAGHISDVVPTWSCAEGEAFQSPPEFPLVCLGLSI